MVINKKGLTDKEIQKLIDTDIEYSKWFNESYLPMYVQSQINEIMFKALRDSQSKPTKSKGYIKARKGLEKLKEFTP